MPNFKPASDPLVDPLWVDEIPRIYLAGKIRKGVHWRSELTGGDARPLSVLDPETGLDSNYSELIDGVTGDRNAAALDGERGRRREPNSDYPTSAKLHALFLAQTRGVDPWEFHIRKTYSILRDGAIPVHVH
jgi:hypothetical protein